MREEGGEIINSLVNFARLLISEKDTAEMLLPATIVMRG
jgi:hypothetical protein